MSSQASRQLLRSGAWLNRDAGRCFGNCWQLVGADRAKCTPNQLVSENWSKSSGSARPLYHFVNGGGGAYLSIGGALAWPSALPVEPWAFYPGPEAVRAKLDAETPIWKQPIWTWIKHFRAWPVSTETLSGIFDFNHAPFSQSFIEVRVERSKRRVVFALHGANGAVYWRDLHASFAGVTATKPDAPVEFVVK
jgi:hypothetical protein